MGKRLRAYVHVHQDDGEVHIYGPHDEVPADDAERIGDHAWVDDDEEPADNRRGVVVENTGGPQPKVERQGSARRSPAAKKAPAKKPDATKKPGAAKKEEPVEGASEGGESSGGSGSGD